MHMDMTGGATVIGALQTISKLGLKKNVVGLVAAAENAVSAHAMRSGDTVTSMSGKTVILHTDAEGRLVLADALTYAQKQYKPKSRHCDTYRCIVSSPRSTCQRHSYER